MLCTGMQICDQQCPHEAIWVNQNGVKVCEYHKLLLDAFNWETRDKRCWTAIDSDADRLNAVKNHPSYFLLPVICHNALIFLMANQSRMLCPGLYGKRLLTCIIESVI